MISNRIFDLITAKYPQVEILKSAYQKFYEVIMEDDVERLHRFLETYNTFRRSRQVSKVILQLWKLQYQPIPIQDLEKT